MVTDIVKAPISVAINMRAVVVQLVRTSES